MLPLITAALGLLQQNKQGQEDRKQQMQAAAMGQFANAPGPQASGGGKLGALAGIGSAIGGMMGGEKAGISNKPIAEISPTDPGVQSTGGPLGAPSQSANPYGLNPDEDLLQKLGQSQPMYG